MTSANDDGSDIVQATLTTGMIIDLYELYNTDVVGEMVKVCAEQHPDKAFVKITIKVGDRFMYKADPTPEIVSVRVELNELPAEILNRVKDPIRLR